jgi:ADP-heptose:LPS heptosyltransferase
LSRRVLVIKLSALGDMVQAFGPFQAIRRAHPDAHVSLLTTRPYVDLADRSGWFDAVLVDPRPKAWQLGKVRALRAMLREGRFDRVYDLQTSDRSSGYLRLLGGPGAVEWSGIARGCSHPHANPRRDALHTVERQAEQLRMAGIAAVPAPDLAWMAADVSRFALPEPFVLLVPGGAPHRPQKRWPADRYAALAQRLAAGGTTPVVLGTEAERAEAETVAAACPEAVVLIGRTSLFDIAALARRAAGAVGNDTGPMHLIAAAGCPSVVLYSQASDPALCGQRGPCVDILRRPDLADLEAAEVLAALDGLSVTACGGSGPDGRALT